MESSPGESTNYDYHGLKAVGLTCVLLFWIWTYATFVWLRVVLLVPTDVWSNLALVSSELRTVGLPDTERHDLLSNLH